MTQRTVQRQASSASIPGRRCTPAWGTCDILKSRVTCPILGEVRTTSPFYFNGKARVASNVMANLPFSAELTDDSHVVHGLTVSTFCFRTLDSSDETLIDQSLSFLFFGVFLFLLRQSLLSAGEDESYLFYRAAYLHRLPLER